MTATPLNMLFSSVDGICTPLLQKTARDKTSVAECQPQTHWREQQPGEESSRPGEVFVLDMFCNAGEALALFGKRVGMHPALHRPTDLGVGKPMLRVHIAVAYRPAYRQEAEPESEIGDRSLGQRVDAMEPTEAQSLSLNIRVDLREITQFVNLPSGDTQKECRCCINIRGVSQFNILLDALLGRGNLHLGQVGFIHI